MQNVRRQKAIPCRTDSTAFYPVTGSANLFLQSIFRSPVSSVPSVNIPLSSPLCSYSLHSSLQSALFLQSTFRSPVRSVPPVNIPLFSQLFPSDKIQLSSRSVSAVNIPLSSLLCPSSQYSVLQSTLLLQ